MAPSKVDMAQLLRVAASYKKKCDKCSKKAKWSFRGRDGKMHGACKKHLKEVG